MAGDWIKWTKGLARKREVLMMANTLNTSPFAIASALMQFWEWCDDNISDADMDENGNAFVTVGALQPVTVDSLSGMPGLANAMQAAGWLRLQDSKWVFPNFARHNGQTAKQRALTARRVNKTREKRNALSVTNVTVAPLPEKRREEDINTPLPPKGGNDISSTNGKQKRKRRRMTALEEKQASLDLPTGAKP